MWFYSDKFVTTEANGWCVVGFVKLVNEGERESHSGATKSVERPSKYLAALQSDNQGAGLFERL